MSIHIDSGLVAVIRCPVTKSPLHEANLELIENLNQQIETGSLVNRIGQTVSAKLDSGFVNADQSLLLPVRGGIVVLLSDEAIVLDGFNAGS